MLRSFIQRKRLAPAYPRRTACGSLVGLSTSVAPGTAGQHKSVAVMLPAILALAFLRKIAAGVGIYSFAAGLVGVAQSLIVRRRAGRLS